MYKPECIYSLKYPFFANGLILNDTEPFHSMILYSLSVVENFIVRFSHLWKVTFL